MALASTVVWEVRTDGDDNNGGGFDPAYGGTDYSQQAAAQLTVTDAATSGVGSTTLTSATGGFTSAMVGNVLHLYGGTNLTEGWYEIVGYTDGNTVTLDRAPDDGVGGVSGATCKVGGALGSPGGLGAALVNALVAGHRAWIKSGTYTITSDTYNVSGGPLNVNQAKSFLLEGYGTTRGDGVRPLITKAAGLTGSGSYFMIGLYGALSTVTQRCRYIECDISGYVNNTAGFKHTSSYTVYFEHCIARNGLYGFYGGRCLRCYAESCKYGFSGSTVRYGHAKSCDYYGFSRGDNFGCIAESCNVGFGSYSGTYHCRCTAYGSTTDGFQVEAAMGLVDCLSVGSGGYGFANSASDMVHIANCCAYNNASGDFQITPDPDDTVTITADPFIDALSGDFRLNDDPNGGAILKGAGLGVYGQIDSQDIGAVQAAKQLGGAVGRMYF